MRKFSRHMLAIVGVAAILLVGAITTVIFGEIGGAVIAVAGLQLVVLYAVLDVRRHQVLSGRSQIKQERLTRRLDRQTANMAMRSVTEAQAAERSLSARLAQAEIAIVAQIHNADQRVIRRATEQTQDIEAIIQLFGRVAPRAAMPSSGSWAMDPRGLLSLVELAERDDVQTILELGSGTSTLWLAYALERRGNGGRLISLDHDAHYADATRSALALHGFDPTLVEVRDAPLVDGVVEGHVSPWYDPNSFTDLAGIDLLIVDGPPGGTGEQARYPALPALMDRLSPGAIVVVDDAGRDDERRMIEKWRDLAPGLVPMPGSEGGRQVVLTLKG